MIIELHALQTFAPSNLNRDDTGNPKDALFGGVRRARISSQSAKRAMRVSSVFCDALTMDIGTRTKSVGQMLLDRLMSQGINEEAATEPVEELVQAVFAKPDSKDKKKTNVLVYISPAEFDWLAANLLDVIQNGAKIEDVKKEFSKQIKNRDVIAPDIALFGRMLAENPSLNIDAACQVAHALSTHAVETAEFDYFTAVDDLLPSEETGAGMLGLTAFNSATYYRCLRVDWEQLIENLGGDTVNARTTVDALMRAFALVVPSAMQNVFLNKHMPDFLLAVVRPHNDGQSLMNAFENPVRPARAGGYVDNSVKALVAYWEQCEKAFRLDEPTVISVMNPRGIELASDELQSNVQVDVRAWIKTVTDGLLEEAN